MCVYRRGGRETISRTFSNNRETSSVARLLFILLYLIFFAVIQLTRIFRVSRAKSHFLLALAHIPFTAKNLGFFSFK